MPPTAVRRRRSRAAAAIAGALCVAGAWLATAAWSQPVAADEAATPPSAVLALPADAARGKQAFEECQGCHRRDASGRAGSNIPRLSAQHASVIVKQILDIRSGLRSNPPMKPYVEAPVLPLQAIADIAAHLQGLPIVGNIAKGTGSDAARGQPLYLRDCAACHGAAGEGNAALYVPMLAGQHHPYLLRELGLIRDGRRGNSNPVMAALVQGYTPADLQAVADYLAQLPVPVPGR